MQKQKKQGAVPPHTAQGPQWAVGRILYLFPVVPLQQQFSEQVIHSKRIETQASIMTETSPFITRKAFCSYCLPSQYINSSNVLNF
jgi:hypothetical protein